MLLYNFLLVVDLSEKMIAAKYLLTLQYLIDKNRQIKR